MQSILHKATCSLNLKNNIPSKPYNKQYSEILSRNPEDIEIYTDEYTSENILVKYLYVLLKSLRQLNTCKKNSKLMNRSYET